MNIELTQEQLDFLEAYFGTPNFEPFVRKNLIKWIDRLAADNAPPRNLIADATVELAKRKRERDERTVPKGKEE